MKLTIALEQRFFMLPDKTVWTESGGSYAFWQRYLNIFDVVEVVARVKTVNRTPSNCMRADGDNVTFAILPHYVGPFQYLCNFRKIFRISQGVVKRAEAVLLRAPGQISSVLYWYLSKANHPFGIEVIGDPYDVFSPGSVDHVLRRFFRWIMTKQLKQQCKAAVASAYVTEKTLQKRYPNIFYSTHYSSIEISKEAYASFPKFDFGENGVFRLVYIGSLEQLYKSPDILIDAVALCQLMGCKISLRMIGDGKFRPQLEERVNRLGLKDSVIFMGQLSAGDSVRNELLQADLFILPSRTEGLPRAMIEAMACGLPCIGTNVGGIPELLPAEDLVPSGSVQALADKIEEIITSPERMQTMSVRNLEKSLEFRNDILEHRRREFYNHLREKTELWLEEKNIK